MAAPADYGRNVTFLSMMVKMTTFSLLDASYENWIASEREGKEKFRHQYDQNKEASWHYVGGNLFNGIGCA